MTLMSSYPGRLTGVGCEGASSSLLVLVPILRNERSFTGLKGGSPRSLTPALVTMMTRDSFSGLPSLWRTGGPRSAMGSGGSSDVTELTRSM